MLLVLLFIGIIAAIVFTIIAIKLDLDSEGMEVILPIMIISACILISLGGIALTTIKLVRLKPAEQKIEYLTQNNLEIETKIIQSIKAYCEYEGKTYIEITPENSTVIFIAYPELKADELFKSYLDTLQSNNEEIRNLRLKTFDASILRWWLYFGE